MNNQPQRIFEGNRCSNRSLLLLKKEKKKKEKKIRKENMERYIEEVEKRELKNRRILKPLESKDFLFNVWEKKIIFNFNILSHYATNLFMMDIQFPIDLIRYILYTLLICEQNAIKPTKHDNHSNYLFSPCTQSECIVNWWKNFQVTKNHMGGWRIPHHCGYSIDPTYFNNSLDINLSKLIPHHCHNIGTVRLPYICWSCKRYFCESCGENNKFEDFEPHFRCNNCIPSYNQGILFHYVRT